MVIDMATIEEASADDDYNGDYYKSHDFFEYLYGMVDRRKRGGLKIMVISLTLGVASAHTLDGDTDVEAIRIFTDMGRKVQRLMRQPKYRAFNKKRQQRFGQQLQSTFEHENP